MRYKQQPWISKGGQDIFRLGQVAVLRPGINCLRAAPSTRRIAAGRAVPGRQYNLFLCIQRAQGLRAARLPGTPPWINKSERLTHPPRGRIAARVIMLLEQRPQTAATRTAALSVSVAVRP